jgi:RNA polymerase sigma-70 factor (ECF subfamily)
MQEARDHDQHRELNVAADESSTGSSLRDASDEELALQVLKSRDAFLTLYLRYVNGVYSYFTWKFGSTDAEDLTSDVFLRVLEASSKFQRGRNWRAWLFGIARNRAMEFSRQLKRSAKAAPSEGSGEHALSAADTAERAEEENTIRRMVEALPQQHREVIELRYWAGLSFPEMAQVLDRREGALRVQMHRILQILRRELRDRWPSDV